MIDALELAGAAGDMVIDRIAARLTEAGAANGRTEAAALVEAFGREGPALDAAVDRCVAGEPVGLVLGRARFCGLSLEVMPGTLAPRAETEMLANRAIETLRSVIALNETVRLGNADGPLVVDMCCGVGNIALAIATHVPTAMVHAADLTEACVATAARNVERLGLGARVMVHRGDLFGAVEGYVAKGTVDVIACNPPYISTSRLAGDRAPLLAHEPREAFDAGPYGLGIHQRVIREAPAYLAPRGWLMFEFGAGQAKQISLLFDRSKQFGPVSFVRDEAGVERVAYAQRKESESNS